MRKRQKAKQQEPAAMLVAFGEAWRAALNRDDHKTAARARQQADAILKRHPEYRQHPPNRAAGPRVSKNLFIEWEAFLEYPTG